MRKCFKDVTIWLNCTHTRFFVARRSFFLRLFEVHLSFYSFFLESRSPWTANEAQTRNHNLFTPVDTRRLAAKTAKNVLFSRRLCASRRRKLDVMWCWRVMTLSLCLRFLLLSSAWCCFGSCAFAVLARRCFLFILCAFSLHSFARFIHIEFSVALV